MSYGPPGRLREAVRVGAIDPVFTEDGTYHDMMAKPVSGRKNLRKLIGGFLKGWTATEWEVINIVSRVSVVIAERPDKTRLGDKKVDLPCVGVFEMENGRIKVWRDYFDLARYTKAIA